MASATDPVCGMTVRTDEAAGTSTYQGRTFYFCSTACKQRFDESPGEFVPATAAS